MTTPPPEVYTAALAAARDAYRARVGLQPAEGHYVDVYATAAVDAVWPLAQQALRQHMFAAALTEPGEDETPALMSRFEREVRAKVAAEIRAGIQPGSRMPLPVTGGVANAWAQTAEWAARIAEGGDTDG